MQKWRTRKVLHRTSATHDSFHIGSVALLISFIYFPRRTYFLNLPLCLCLFFWSFLHPCLVLQMQCIFIIFMFSARFISPVSFSLCVRRKRSSLFSVQIFSRYWFHVCATHCNKKSVLFHRKSKQRDEIRFKDPHKSCENFMWDAVRIHTKTRYALSSSLRVPCPFLDLRQACAFGFLAHTYTAQHDICKHVIDCSNSWKSTLLKLIPFYFVIINVILI